MTEDFLQFIWKYQKFLDPELKTTNGKKINVFSPGKLNRDAGPDFVEARIKIDEIEWSGSVELHLKSQDWFVHRHHQDKTYQQVVLHVVWQDNAEIPGMETLELKNIVSDKLIHHYRELSTSKDDLPCIHLLHGVKPITIFSTMERMVAQRMEKKCRVIMSVLNSSQGDWQEAAYRVLMKAFGFQINASAFEALSRALPYEIIRKYRSKQQDLEALLFGQAGFLEETNEDDYMLNLRSRYQFLAVKHNILEYRLSVERWKFLRLRPANFPTLRIAQLASLFHQTSSLHASFLTITNSKELAEQFNLTPSDYWRDHYHFEKATKKRSGRVGKGSYEGIGINVVVPLIWTYGQYTNDLSRCDQAFGLLQSLGFEKNSITSKFPVVFPQKSAFESQSQIELYNSQCSNKRCLDCSVGIEITNLER